MIVTISRSLPWLLLLWGFAGTASAQGQPMAFEGVIDLKYTNSKSQPKSARFRCESDPETQIWRIDDTRDFRSELPRGAYKSGDLVIIKTGIKTAQGLEHLGVSSVIDGYPLNLQWADRLIWFVYCARDYLLEHNQKPVIVPRGDVQTDFDAHGCRANIQWRSHRDLCPVQVDFIFENKLFEQSIQHLKLEPPGRYLDNRRREIEAYKRRVTDGGLVARFRVTEWGETANWGVPHRWRLEVFRGDRMTRTFDGITEGVSEIAAVELPITPERASISDFRFRSVALGRNALPYLITDGNIPGVSIINGEAIPVTTSAAIQAMAAQFKNPNRRLMPPEVTGRTGRRALFLSVIAALILLGPILIFTNHLKQSRKP